MYMHACMYVRIYTVCMYSMYACTVCIYVCMYVYNLAKCTTLILIYT